MLGGSKQQSDRIIEYLTPGKVQGMMWDAPKAPIWVMKDNATKSKLSIGSHGEILSLACSEASVRGPHPSRLRCDEIETISIPLLEIALLQPKTKHGVTPQIVCSSTWHNPSGTVSELKKRNLPCHTWCYKETLEPHGFTKQTDIDMLKDAGISEESWRVEMECGEPRLDAYGINRGAVERCFAPDDNDNTGYDMRGVPGRSEWIHPNHPKPNTRYAHGVDWAQSKDFTVITTIEVPEDGQKKVVGWLKVNKIRFDEMAEMVNRRVKTFGGVVWHDSTGIGAVIADMLTVPKYDFDFRNVKRRTQLIGDYVHAIESNQLKFPHIISAYEDHRDCTTDTLYGLGHTPDSIVSGALAWAAVRTNREVLVGRLF
ncbi:MAG: hypothetical protein KDH96_02260 [Candidatus Riesia sp.]|nr:hypothetical protein [Candidatus Riesia sp.]